MNVRTFNRKLNFFINNEILTVSSIETIIKSDNTYHWHEELGNDPSIMGLDRALSKEEILKDGDIVIIDSDYIYNPEQVKYIDFGNSKVKSFEKRYKKELEAEKKSRQLKGVKK